MDVIQIARQLGKAIQQDQRYINLTLAQQTNEDDTPLQGMIEKFNAIREALNSETKRTDRESAKIEEMNAALSELYAQIFENQNMKNYVSARNELNQLVSHINQIIAGSSEGRDPDEIGFQQSCSGGSCSSCSGC